MATFDTVTGLLLTTTDPNGLETRIEYEWNTLRPLRTKTYYNNNQQVGSEAETIYHDEAGNYWVKNRARIDVNKWAESITYFDGLGRAYKAEEVNSEGNIFVEKEFDAEGRVKRVTNPFRANETKQWTTNVYDNASRIKEVVMPDGAKVTTDYSVAISGTNTGTMVTITDQAGKQRRSITNALGQLTRVDEPDDSGNPGSVGSPVQPTNYGYDILNNLTTVTQGIQTRTFGYDSLSRLKQATNPESGTISYTYDNNGNLQTRRDARGIKTIYDYDGLNRVVKRCYRDIGTSAPLGMTTCANNSETPEPNTPDVAYFYDNLPNAKGKLTKVTNGFSTTEYEAFDILGRITQSQQTTDGTVYDSMTYTYNLSDALIEQKYPSGRVVKNVLDNDGYLAIIQSKKNQNSGYFNYAKNFTYTASGTVSSMQFGNGRWESTVFNSRLQPTQIALGTVQNGTDKLKLNFTYNTTGQNNNNGNILSQTITVPTEIRNGTTYTGFTATQTYTYDSLNRIKQASENLTPLNQSTYNSWTHTFTYDRYGNRQFDEANTTTLPKNCGTSPNFTVCTNDRKVLNPSISTSNNRIIQDQDGDSQNDYLFDSSGNTTKDAMGRTFIYDAENKQIEVKDSQNQTIGQYFYDGDGKRVKKYIPSTGETTIFIYDASGKMVAEYSTQVAAQQDAKVSYLTTDHLGSPRINTDANGNVTARHDYQPFGEEIARASYGADAVRKQFTGYEKDSETDLDFAQARYYSSKLGRFYTVDPENAGAMQDEPQSWNAYAYVGNNPLNITDPTGEKWAMRDNGNGVVTFRWYDDTIPEEWGEGWSEYTHSWFVGSNEAIYLGTGGASDYYRVKKEGYFSDHDWNHFGTTQSLAGRISDDQIRILMRARIDQFMNTKPVQDYMKALDTTEELVRVIHALHILKQITSLGSKTLSQGKTISGYKGGKIFRNDGRGGGEILPKTDSSGKQITYREYDVNPYTKGINRGTERIVRGSDGSAYYTNDHYKTFKKLE